MEDGAAWLDEVPRTAGPPWLSMGLRSLGDEPWLIVDDHYDAELAEKDRLTALHREAVFATRPAADAAGRETAELVEGWLAAHQPDRLRGRAAVLDGLEPLERAGRLVQEDLCLMITDGDGVPRLEAASLCFPSHWVLADKLGLPLGAIHAPVPHYAEELGVKVDRFFDRLHPDRPVVRRNLSFHDHDDLYRPEPSETADSFGPSVDDVWLRSERQTLRRLPKSGAVLFTIKTQQAPLRALADRPGLASDLASKLTALEEHGEPPHWPAWLVGWLVSRCS